MIDLLKRFRLTKEDALKIVLAYILGWVMNIWGVIIVVLYIIYLLVQENKEGKSGSLRTD